MKYNFIDLPFALRRSTVLPPRGKKTLPPFPQLAFKPTAQLRAARPRQCSLPEALLCPFRLVLLAGAFDCPELSSVPLSCEPLPRR